MNASSLLIAVAGIALFVGTSPASGANGYTPAPEKTEDWPGKGVVWNGDHWNKRRGEFWANREKDKGAVVFFGDSITEGWYTLSKDFPKWKCANRGISGDPSRSLVFRLKEDLLDLEPRAVVILIGVNDIASGGLPEDIAWNIRYCVTAIQRWRSGTPVVINKVMPWGNAQPHHRQRIALLNRMIEAIPIGRVNVRVCDTWSIFADENGNPAKDEFPDLLHPNASARVKWHKALNPILEEVVK